MGKKQSIIRPTLPLIQGASGAGSPRVDQMRARKDELIVVTSRG